MHTKIKQKLYDFVAEYKDLSFQKRLRAEGSFETAKTIEKILKPTFREIRQSILIQKVAEMHLGYTLSYYMSCGQGTDLMWEKIEMELNFVKTAIRKPVAGSKLNTRFIQNTKPTNRADVINAIRQVVVTEKMEYKQVVDLIEDRIATSRRKTTEIGRTEGRRCRPARSIAQMEANREIQEFGFDIEKMWLSTLDSNAPARSHLNG